MIRALVVDDEPAARRGLRRRLAAFADIDVIGECADGEAAVAAIPELRPDLVFLDIQMPGLDGFGVIEAVGLARMPAVVFVTAYDQFALKAFDVHAVDYVLKPLDDALLQRALERVRLRQRDRDDGWKSRVEAVLRDLGADPARSGIRRLAIPGNGRVILLDVADVDRIESAGNYVQVFQGRKAHLLRETLSHLEERLDRRHFVRVSRAAIVNIDRVRELQPMFNGDFVLVLKDGTEVSGSRRYRESLRAVLG